MNDKQRKAMWASRKGYSNQPRDLTECMMGGSHKQMPYKFGKDYQTCAKCGNYIRQVNYNPIEKRRLSVVADNPVDHLKDVNGRFLGKRSRLFHSKSVNNEMLPTDEHEKVMGVWEK